MDLKLIGAVFVIVGCGGVGFLMALGHKREISAMKDLLTVLDYMRCELEFRLTPLPELCGRASRFCRGSVSAVLERLSGELDSQISPDVSSCVEIALKKTPELPVKTRSAMQSLGRSLGNFDLPGQLNGIRAHCHQQGTGTAGAGTNGTSSQLPNPGTVRRSGAGDLIYLAYGN